MTNEFRPAILGALADEIKAGDPREAIAKVEKDLMESAESLRKIRSDYVNGVISEAELDQVEKEFEKRLIQQRQILQNLKKAVQSEKGA
jgi:hypothetical protein